MSQPTPPPPTPGLANRRDFLRRAGLGLGVAVSASTLQACDFGGDPPDVPPEGTLRGTVVNPDGVPIEGASVTVEGLGATATTDENGFYQFTDVPEGEYTVTVAAFGPFDEQTAEVNIIRGGTGYTQNFNFGNTLPTVTFDFSSDIGVLNYAYALEQLEAAFYAAVVADADFTSTFSEDEQLIFSDLAAHEGIHRDFLAAALGSNAIPDLLPNFDDIDFSDRSEVLATAQVFEDLGVAAYNGAGQYISDDTYLTLAGKIVSVEARHAAVISGLIEANSLSGGVIDENGLDQALSPSAVLTAADPYIFNMVSASNVPA